MVQAFDQENEKKNKLVNEHGQRTDENLFKISPYSTQNNVETMLLNSIQRKKSKIKYTFLLKSYKFWTFI